MRSQTADDVFIRAEQRVIARRLLDLSSDASWWPGLRAGGTYGYVTIDAPAGLPRGRARFGAIISPVREWEGFTWTINDGHVVGRAEWWLEPYGEGTIVHYFLDVERGPARTPWSMTARVRRHRRAIRRGLNALKDELGSTPVAAVSARTKGSPATR